MVKKSKINKFSTSGELLGIIKEEYVLTEGSGKWLLIAILANILPIVTSIAFIPFIAQITTALILGFFLKRYVITNKNKKIEAVKNKNISFTINKLGYALIWLTIIIQFPFMWLPYISQVTSTILLVIIYATMTSYKEK